MQTVIYGPFALGSVEWVGGSENRQTAPTLPSLWPANRWLLPWDQAPTKVSWRRPRPEHWYQLDLILIRQAAVRGVLHMYTHAMVRIVTWTLLQDWADTADISLLQEAGEPSH